MIIEKTIYVHAFVKLSIKLPKLSPTFIMHQNIDMNFFHFFGLQNVDMI